MKKSRCHSQKHCVTYNWAKIQNIFCSIEFSTRQNIPTFEHFLARKPVFFALSNSQYCKISFEFEYNAKLQCFQGLDVLESIICSIFFFDLFLDRFLSNGPLMFNFVRSGLWLCFEHCSPLVSSDFPSCTVCCSFIHV